MRVRPLPFAVLPSRSLSKYAQKTGVSKKLNTPSSECRFTSIHRAFLIAVTLYLLTCTGLSAQECTLSAAASSGLPCSQVLLTSGKPWQDQGFIREIYFLDRIYGVNPAFRMCQEVRGPNAFASPQVIDPSATDGTVYFGVKLAQGELSEYGETTNFSIPAIMAHEFAHILQFKQAVRLPTKLKELQADYLAGWFMGNRDRFSGWSAKSFRDSLQSFFEKGDYSFNSPTHHGTPAERAEVITRGFQSANLPLAAVFQQSYVYVSRLGNGNSAQGKQSTSELGSPQQGRTPSAGSLSEVLSRLIQSNGDFSQFKGRHDPDGDSTEWISTLNLPGASSCDVEIKRGFNAGQTFSCQMGEFNDLGEANAAFEQLVTSIAQALPTGWTREEGTTGKYTRRSIDFRRGPSEAWISVSLQGTRRISTSVTMFSPDVN